MKATETVAVRASQRRLSADASRHLTFLGLVVATIAWFWTPLATVVSLSLQYGQYEHYSHIVAIPFIAAFLIYLDRRVIFATADHGSRLGAFVMAVGVAGSFIPSALAIKSETAWSIGILSMVTTGLGAFVLCYGTRAFKKASFGLLLLVLMAPLPPFVLQAIVGFLQHASTEATAVLFEILGVPVFRQGFVFALPGLTIEVAEECSGIRSSVGLFITSLVAGHLLLRSRWAKASLVLAVVPLAIVKNAVRIVVLSLLAIHVDPAFITGSAFHRYSGLPVFGVSLVILGAIVWLLQSFEARARRRAA